MLQWVSESELHLRGGGGWCTVGEGVGRVLADRVAPGVGPDGRNPTHLVSAPKCSVTEHTQIYACT